MKNLLQDTELREEFLDYMDKLDSLTKATMEMPEAIVGYWTPSSTGEMMSRLHAHAILLLHDALNLDRAIIEDLKSGELEWDGDEDPDEEVVEDYTATPFREYYNRYHHG